MAKLKVGVLTGGGDCPGLNAVIRAITRMAIIEHGCEVVGICDGFEGAVEGRMRPLTFDDVSNILSQGGTILGTSNKADPFNYTMNGGEPTDETKSLLNNFDKWGIDALFCIGGDGTMAITNRLAGVFPRVIGIPKTIDNDLMATDQTFGFDTACNFVTSAIDRIHTTAQSHHRAMVVEVMGRYAGWIALEGGMAGGGDIILIPEMPFSFDKITEAIKARRERGKKFSIVVVSEGSHPEGQGMVVRETIVDSPDPIRLGGIGQLVANEIEKRSGVESRVTVLGHLQRGGTPSFYDRVLATRYGQAAGQLAADGEFGKMVALKGTDIVAVDLKEATSGLKLVTEDNPLLKCAMSLGTSFGV
jgi:ATP-dependent phosphofructokinase / diphosphate-dependent phosphofructokinase